MARRLVRPPRPSTVLKLACFAFLAPWLYSYVIPHLSPHLPSFLRRSTSEIVSDIPAYECKPHAYSTELVSLDPLLIYIENFLRPSEVTELLEAAEGSGGFSPSQVFKNGRLTGTQDRTSSSAALSRDNPTVSCVLERTQIFLGSMFDSNKDDMGPPQLVRYSEGQQFNNHVDWYDTPQPRTRGSRGKGKSWNRMASLFAWLEDECEGGETWFKYIEPTHSLRSDTDHLWRAHPDGGLAFRPIARNALFWVNLHGNGTGDERVRHAGLKVVKGGKTAMNIWPRKFYD
ncbi:hypothetical protein F5Y18DRAFT_430208 [Xylariaceae sp. FL1019]|nr:hypothetical protein F5Y18DRAFT_430208 [Xylariaceae sp. FL1019]